METFYVRKIKDIIQNKEEIEKKLETKLQISGNNITIDTTAIKEFEAESVFEAINFGFSIRKALLLAKEDYAFRKIKIKDHTKRNLAAIKSRLIGKKGKTKRVFSDISNCEILIKESEVGIIGDIIDVEGTETAIISLIKGSKQSNMYRFLEKQNKRKKETPLL